MSGCVNYISPLRHSCHQWCGGCVTIWYHVAVITLSTENFVTFIILTIHRRNMIFASKVCNNTIFTEKMNKNDFGPENSDYDFLILWMAPFRSETMIIFGPWPRGENCFSFLKVLRTLLRNYGFHREQADMKIDWEIRWDIKKYWTIVDFLLKKSR